MTYPLLNVCARSSGNEQQYKLIETYSLDFTQWNELLYQAEEHGMAPLLYKHICEAKVACPDNFKRSLQILNIRHTKVNTIYAKTLSNVLGDFNKDGIDALILKGAAICHTVYPEIGLRPMRDIDILIRKDDALKAERILMEQGFTQSSAPRPADHFHLPSLHKIIDTVPVCIELHHGLYPHCPPYYTSLTFDELLESSFSFKLEDATARTLGHEEMLWHLYQHGFCMPLTYEQYKIINIADVVSLVEKFIDVLDLKKMKLHHKKVIDILPLLHSVTPFNEKVTTILAIKNKRHNTASVGEKFKGWPQLRLANQKNKSLRQILADTFFPPEWWFKMYYGITGRCSYYWHLLIIHPGHIFWWVKLYWHYFYRDHINENNRTHRQSRFEIMTKLKNAKILFSAIFQKLR